MPDPPTLQKLRSAIESDASGRALASVVTALRKKGYQVASHESVASFPRGYNADHPRLELLRMKDIHAGKTLGPSDIATERPSGQSARCVTMSRHCGNGCWSRSARRAARKRRAPGVRAAAAGIRPRSRAARARLTHRAFPNANYRSSHATPKSASWRPSRRVAVVAP